MSTGSLNRHFTSRPHRSTGSLSGLFRTPVPPFHLVFHTPPGFGAEHRLYELHRAANRVFRERLKVYRAKGETLSAPELVAFIRDDVLSNLLAIELLPIGPIHVARFRFLNAKKYWAWLPAHRRRSEALLAEFQKLYRRRRRS